MTPQSPQSIERVLSALAEIRKGRMVILMDDEDRENEGDLVMAAELVTPEAINFMARHGRGLICLSLTEAKIRALDLQMMVDENRSSRGTAFTVSIEAREGVTTGISAADRAHTIRVAANPNAKPHDVVSPGHVFPLRSRPGGVLQRTGHTEGSVDLARLAGCEPAAVICEIMKEDGTMARAEDLRRFAQDHGLCLLTIEDLIQYRLQNERLVTLVQEDEVVLGTGRPWRAHVYRAEVENRQFLALVHGEVGPEPTLVRVQTGSVLGDVFGCRAGLRVRIMDAIRRIEDVGKGVVLFIPGRVDLARDLSFHAGDVVPPALRESGQVLREFGLGAQVLSALGLSRIRLLSNQPRRIVGLESYGLEIVEQILVSPVDADLVAALDERTTH
jgi:3,4-dihydroxy 2-butanone 4-phosphate synthase/GTP cyclohydrolase II